MSLINEALRRAEEEKRRATRPSAEPAAEDERLAAAWRGARSPLDAPLSPRARRPRRRPLILAGLLVLMLAGAGAWLALRPAPLESSAAPTDRGNAVAQQPRGAAAGAHEESEPAGNTHAAQADAAQANPPGEPGEPAATSFPAFMPQRDAVLAWLDKTLGPAPRPACGGPEKATPADAPCPAAPAGQEPPPTSPADPAASVAPAAPPAPVEAAPQPPVWHLTAVVRSDTGWRALINGLYVGVGRNVDGARVVRIGSNWAELECDGRRFVIRM